MRKQLKWRPDLDRICLRSDFKLYKHLFVCFVIIKDWTQSSGNTTKQSFGWVLSLALHGGDSRQASELCLSLPLSHRHARTHARTHPVLILRFVSWILIPCVCSLWSSWDCPCSWDIGLWCSKSSPLSPETFSSDGVAHCRNLHTAWRREN